VIRVVAGELWEMEAEAILRPVAADWSAVTPAMRRLELAAGRALVERCEALGELPVGSAVITDAGALKAEFLIHVAVRSRDEPVSVATVRAAVRNGLRRAAEWGIERLHCAPVGLGAGNLELEECAEAMVSEIRAHLDAGGPPREVVIVVDSDWARQVFEGAVARAAGRGEARGGP
jgi:O-acetyl-ADP-ribose deacetylase (regulator of RNase III)